MIAPISSSTPVTLFDVNKTTFDESREWTGPLAEFIAANSVEADGSLDPEDIAILERSLQENGCFTFGGGAMALSVLRVDGVAEVAHA